MPILPRVHPLLIIAPLLLALAGCISTRENHKQYVDDAHKRWDDLKSGQVIQAAQRFFDAGDLEQADNSLSDALGQDGGNPRVHLLAGRIALERGQLERAYNRFNTAIELNAKLPGPPKLPEPHYYQGVVLQRWQQYDRALASYRQAYDLLPDNPAYLMAVGDMLVAKNEVDQAIALLKDKLTYFDQNAGLRQALGQLYLLKKQPEQAVKMLQEAATLGPTDTQVSEELALALVEAGQYAPAITRLESLGVAPLAEATPWSSGLSSPSAQAAGPRRDLRLALARAYLAVGKNREARKTLAAAARAYPDDGDVWILYTQACWAIGDLLATLEDAHTAIKVAPKRVEGHLLAGLALQELGRKPEALASYQTAAELAPDNADPLLLRGLLLEDLGRRGDAATAYAEALRRQPENDRARRLLAKVTP